MLVKSSTIDIVRASVQSRTGKLFKADDEYLSDIESFIRRSRIERTDCEERQRFGTGRLTHYLRSDAVR